MTPRVILEPSDEGGYTSIVPALPGCIREDDTREQTIKNTEEAIRPYLELVDDDLAFAPDTEPIELAV